MARTGNLVLPTAAQVTQGVAFGSHGTEITGSVVLPTAAQVKNGTTFGASGTQYTGVLVLPTAAQVEDGVGFGANGTQFTGVFLAPGQLSPGATSTDIQTALDDTSLAEVILPSGTTTMTAVVRIRRSDVWFHGHADGTSKLLQTDDIDDGLGTSHTIMIGGVDADPIENVRISQLTIEHDRVTSPDMRAAAIDLYYSCDNLQIDHITGTNLTSDFFLGRPYPWDVLGCDGLKIEDITINGIWEGVFNWHSGKGQNGYARNVHVTASTSHAGYQGPMLWELNIEQEVGDFENFVAEDWSLTLTGTAGIAGGNGGSLGIAIASNSPKGACWYDKIHFHNGTIDGAAYGAYIPSPNYSEGELPAQETLTTFTDCNFNNSSAPWYVYPDSAERPAPQIVSNVCVRTGALSYAHWRTQFAADQECYAKLTNITGVELFVRSQGLSVYQSNYELYFPDTTTAQIWKRYNSVGAPMGADISITHVAGDEWKIRAVGDTPSPGVSTITIYQNGSLIATRTDSDIPGAGYIGIGIAGATTSIDDFGGGAVSTTALLDDFNRSDEAPIDPTDWAASGSWRTGSPNDRLVFIRCTGNTNVPSEDQSRLTAGDIEVDEIDNDWT